MQMYSKIFNMTLVFLQMLTIFKLLKIAFYLWQQSIHYVRDLADDTSNCVLRAFLVSFPSFW
jgi:hypothetical protein